MFIDLMLLKSFPALEERHVFHGSWRLRHISLLAEVRSFIDCGSAAALVN
jgi:hypothetical protein